MFVNCIIDMLAFEIKVSSSSYVCICVCVMIRSNVAYKGFNVFDYILAKH